MTGHSGAQQGAAGRVRRGAIGVLMRGSEYLMIRRADGLPKGGYWCFPGGHVEPGETSRQAIVREVLEELGVTVEPSKRLGAVRVVDPRYILVAWRLVHLGGAYRPAAAEIAEIRWVQAEDLRSVRPSIGSNARVFEMLGV